MQEMASWRRKTGRSGFIPEQKRSKVSPRDDPLPEAPLGEIVKSMSAASARLSKGNAKVLIVKNFKHIASFNWKHGQDAGILVPGRQIFLLTEKRQAYIFHTGCPPRWNPPKTPSQLPEDSGVFYRDLNAASYPRYPIQAAVEACLMNHPIEADQQRQPIDIFGCGSTLGNILRFSSGKGRDFRILVEVIGNTVHLIRQGQSPMETIPGVRGYGHSFPEAYTSWDKNVKGSVSHQRIVSYDFGGLRLLVRYEADGYLPSKVLPGDEGSEPPVRTSGPTSLENLLSSASLSQAALPDPSAKLQVTAAGKEIPNTALFDLKTRTFKRKAEEEAIHAEEMPRLWLRQVPNFILAFHHWGKFNEVNVHDVRPDTRAWEQKNQSNLRRFAGLLHSIVDTARGLSSQRLELTYEGGQELHIRHVQSEGTRSALPTDVEHRWTSWLSGRSQIVGAAEAEGALLSDSEAQRRASTFSPKSNDPEAKDYTACDAECGYCGECAY